MMKWLTALFFSIIVHILIFLSYVLFATESVEKTTRKITNVNFLDDELVVFIITAPPRMRTLSVEAVANANELSAGLKIDASADGALPFALS